jgi:hypothetical protein
MNKIYDQKLHDKARPAEFAIFRLIEKQYEIFGKPDHCGDVDFDKDILTTKFDIEVEWREKHWLGNQREFPYKTITIPFRKMKKMNPWTLFFAVRADCKRALMFTGEEIVKGKVIRKDNIYSKNEEFIELPISGGKYFDL